MKEERILNVLGKVDEKYIKEADPEVKAKRKAPVWTKWGAMAACLCLVIGAITMIPYFGENTPDPQLGEIILSDKTTAGVSYGYDDGETASTKGQLKYLTEEEMFIHENKYVFRGTVSGLTNVTIDFNGEKAVRCIATIVINEVYQGELVVGNQITMLIPCAIDLVGSAVEDTGVIAQLEIGMEGIFMPWVYDENSYMEMNGAILIMQDLAPCGLADGMRWAFLDTEQGLVFLRSAYPGAKDATNLDDIEAYVIEMLK